MVEPQHKPSSSALEPAQDSELDARVDEYLQLLRAGNAPSIDDFAARDPERRERLVRLLTTLAELEGVASPGASATPRELGDFEIVREVGRGGMGVVFEAVQRSLGRRVALKMLPLQATLDPRYLERFRREAREAARLAHPNIVPVHGVGTDGAVHWFAMQFIDGVGLDGVIAALARLDPSRAPVTLAERVAARIVTGSLDGDSSAEHAVAGGLTSRRFRNTALLLRDVARALAYAHEQGVVHRDVKPSNILVDERGHAWLSDFGLCRAESSSELTHTGDLVGTLRYMPPERFSGRSDARGDVYGLGLLLYEMLALRPAFDEPSRTVALRRIQEGAFARPSSADRSIPADLETICLEALAVDPDRRYASARALADDLERVLAGQPIAARRPSARYLIGLAIRRNRTLALVSTGAALALMLGTIAYVISLRAARLAAEAAREAERSQLYAAKIAAAQAALASGDGIAARSQLDAAPVEERGWEWRFLDGELERAAAVIEGSGYQIHALACSEDGATVALLEPDAIVLCDAQNGSVLRRLDGVASNPRACAFVGPTEIALARGGSLESVDWESGAPRRSLAAHSQELTDFAFDARRRVVATASADGTGALWDWASGARLTRFVPVSGELRSLALSDDGARVALGGASGEVSVWNAATGELVWKLRAHAGAIHALAFAPDGERLVVGSADTTLSVRRTSDGALEHTLRGHRAAVTRARFSRDGRQIASSSSDKTVRVWSLGPVVASRAVLGHHAPVTAVEFTPDGKRVWSTGWDSSARAFEIDDPRFAALLGGPLHATSSLAFDPTGRRLAVSGGDGPLVRIYDTLAREQSEGFLSGHSHTTAVAWSHDGRRLAVGEYAHGDIALWDVAERALLRRFSGVPLPTTGLVFHPDGERLFSSAADHKVRAWNIADGECSWTADVGEAALDVALSVDGQWLAAPSWDGTVHLWRTDDLARSRSLAGHTQGAGCVAFSTDGRELASAGEDRTIRLWDVASGACRRVLGTQRPATGRLATAITDVAYLPNERRIASISSDQRLTIWSLDTGEPVLVFDVEGWGHALAFSPDGRMLAAEDSERAIRLWSLAPTRAERDEYALAAGARESAWRLADELLATHGTREAALERLEHATIGSEGVAASAARRLRAAWSGPDEAAEHCWRLALDPQSEEMALWAADSVCWNLARLSHERTFSDPHAAWGAVHYRLGCIWSTRIADESWGMAESCLTIASATLAATDPHLAHTLAFLAMTHARRGEADAARTALARAEQAAASGERRAELAVLLEETRTVLASSAGR